MLINTAILNQFVELPNSLDALEDILIRAGVEIEEAFIRADELKDVVIGLIEIGRAHV